MEKLRVLKKSPQRQNLQLTNPTSELLARNLSKKFVSAMANNDADPLLDTTTEVRTLRGRFSLRLLFLFIVLVLLSTVLLALVVCL